MESSPSKRRKTSPTTSVPIDAPATPSRIPVLKDGAKALSGRPSFASPTKASIARHNPQLLNRPSSSGTGAERPSSRGRNLEDVFARALGGVRPSVEGRDGILNEERAESLGSTTQENEAPEEERRTPGAVSHPSRRRSLSVGGGLSAKPRRISRSPAKQTTKNFSSTQAGIGASEEPQTDINPFKKTGLRRSPIASQEPRTQQENINPFQKRGLRRSPISSQPLAPLEQTNSQGGEQPEISTTPHGLPPIEVVAPNNLSIQNVREEIVEETQQSAASLVEETTNSEHQEQSSEPVHHPQHEKALEPPSQSRSNRVEEPELPPTPTERGIPDPVVTTPPTGIHNTPSKKAKRSKALGKKLKSSPLKPQDPAAPAAKAPETAKQPEPRVEPREKSKRRKSARFSVPEDPHIAKKKARDDLLKELQQLQADVALTNQENERLRQHYESKRSAPVKPSNYEELLAVLIRATAPEPAAEPEPKSIFKSIASFLPFNSRRKCSSAVLPTLDKPVGSHLPVALDDPLPYLQAFSPLTYSSNTVLLATETDSSDVSEGAPQAALQKHLITASHPSGLFNARFSMTVDPSVPSISAIEFEKIPSSAEKELGTFIREQTGPDTTLFKDISILCWAMGRWVEVSVLRARFWCAVEQDFSTPEARTKSLQQKKKRKRHHVVTESDDTVPLDGHEEDQESRKHKWTRRQMLPHMGRAAMELKTDELEIRIEWKIWFDWTGEVESSISASARLPMSCKFPSVVFNYKKERLLMTACRETNR
jgi:hypothetical protein